MADTSTFANGDPATAATRLAAVHPSGLRRIPKETSDGGWNNGLYKVHQSSLNKALPWRLAAIPKVMDSRLVRYFATRDEALVDAERRTREYQKAYEASHPETVGYFKKRKRKLKIGRPKEKRELPRWKEDCFECVFANPVAQVWLCTKERSNRGRKLKGGKTPEQYMLPHRLRECAVLKLDQPVRDVNNQIRVFPDEWAARDYVKVLFYASTLGERCGWQEWEPTALPSADGDLPKASALKSTENFSIHFAPDRSDRKQGERHHDFVRPFVIKYIPQGRVILRKNTRAIEGALVPVFPDDTGRVDHERHKQLARTASPSTQPLRFRSITAALSHAEKLERTLLGEVVVGINDDIVPNRTGQTCCPICLDWECRNDLDVETECPKWREVTGYNGGTR